jgi:hypothetical protein
MELIAAVLAIVTLVAVLIAAANALWQFFTTTARLLRRLRFGLFDLFFLLTVIGIGRWVIRTTWNTPNFGYSFLVPVVIPFFWLARFALDDYRERRARFEARRRAAIPDLSESIDQPAHSQIAKRQRKPSRWWAPRPTGNLSTPRLSPYSLSEHPLKSDDP